MEFFLTGVFALCAIGALKMSLPERFKMFEVWRVIGGMILIYMSFWTLASSAVGYNDAGQCTHIRTLRGAEGARCDAGWYFSGWGKTTSFPHFVTVTNTTDQNLRGTSVEAPYIIRMKDNWSGKVSQTTRFELPSDPEEFLKLAQNFGSIEKLLASSLRPAVSSSLDSVANFYSMEEYYAGGKRETFKAAYREAVSKGVVTSAHNNRALSSDASSLRASFSNGTQVTRTPHSFEKYGITVDLAVVHSLHPDSGYATLIEDRKHAANKRILAREKRLAEEEQHLLAVARQEIEVAKQKTEALITQARLTTQAETEKQINIISAKSENERAQIEVNTAGFELERARIKAEALKITAQADAFQRKAIMVADGALDKRLKAYTETNQAWADAFARRSVPTTLFQSASDDSGNNLTLNAATLMEFLNKRTERDLNVEVRSEPEAIDETSKDPIKTSSHRP